MPNKGKALFIFLLLFMEIRAQEIPAVWQEWLGTWNEDETSVEQNLLKLSEWLNHPLSLNQCTQEELMEIPGISPQLADAIIQHRLLSGPYQSLYELQVLPAMDPGLFN